MKRRVIIIAIIVILILGGALVAKQLILGNAPEKTPPAQSTQTQVVNAAGSASAAAESTKTKDSTTQAPNFDKSIVVDDTRYFDNNTWLVATVELKDDPGNIAYIIMQQQNGNWETVAGPGTDFGDGLPPGTPQEIADYLQNPKYQRL